MLNTKNVLMLVVLSAGLLSVLTGTAVSQVQPAFADKDEEECKDNGNFNCNEETQKVHQENNCKIVNEIKNDDKSDDNTNGGNGNGDITCWNFAQNPEDGNAIVDEDVLDPFSLIP
jgi:hypothetical protein